MRFLRQSTASQEILLGPFVAAADGSAQTGLTIANTDIKLLYAGGTSENNKNSGGGTHIAGGRYSAVLDATDTATVGILEVSVNPASGIPWSKSYFVLEATRYDALFGSAANSSLFGDIGHGTLQSATASTAVLASATSIADDLINNAQIEITGGTGAGQQRVITDWVSATDTATVSPNWTTTPDNTSTYIVRAMAPAVTDTAALPTVLLSVGTGTGQVNLSGGKAPATIAAGDIAASALTASALAADAVDEILDEQLTDSVPADGTLPTVRQALYMLTQFMFERSVSGTTLTVRKADGSTSLMTFTLSDATSPTSITRAT